MEINANDIPANGKIRFDYIAKNYLCYIEWDDGEYSHSVCGSGKTQQNALNNALERKERR
jgi:hypothetical protein